MLLFLILALELAETDETTDSTTSSITEDNITYYKITQKVDHSLDSSFYIIIGAGFFFILAMVIVVVVVYLHPKGTSSAKIEIPNDEIIDVLV